MLISTELQQSSDPTASGQSFRETRRRLSPARLIEQFARGRSGSRDGAARLNPKQFTPISAGSGVFGQWILDRAGLPAYRYTLDQYQKTAACYPNSEDLDRRDHWHQIGNDHITALASNDGTVQVYLCDRGGVFLNRFEARDFETSHPSPASQFTWKDWVADPVGRLLALLARGYRTLLALWNRLRYDSPAAARAAPSPLQPRGAAYAAPIKADAQRIPLDHPPTPHAYAGGFGYLDDGQAVWATAYRYRPAGADVQRVFGMGYYETSCTHRQLRVTRHVCAPYGDDAALVIDVQIENLGAAPVAVRYYEYWDVNVHQLEVQWLRTGLLASIGDAQRRALNDHFTPAIAWDEAHHALRFHQEPRSEAARPPDQPSMIDWSPADVFLSHLAGPAPVAYYRHKEAFFGEGGAQQPDAIRRRADLEEDARLDNPMPYCLVLRHDLHLDPGRPLTLRFAYGAERPDQTLQFVEKYRNAEVRADTLEQWKNQLAYFTTGRDAALQREMAWHAYSLLSSTVYSAYYDLHVVPQGSAYLYLHGADGAPRDQALFTLPLVYLRPALARDLLRFLMRLQHADTGALPYAFVGYGMHDDAGLHANPSDLDLFFLLALSEYLAATGDVGFLDQVEPFYPRGAQPIGLSGSTVLDHVRAAITHLRETVGVGENRLIKIGDGDWSDAIVLQSAIECFTQISYDNSKAHGESIPNSQMAVYVLPHLAAHLAARDPALAAGLHAWADELKQALDLQWSSHGPWYIRAILRDHGDHPVRWNDEQIGLEAQPWALISGLAAEAGHATALIEAIAARLDRPSPIGAPLAERGTVWPAISQLLTWGYMRHRPDLAWRSLRNNTFAAHARIFQDSWINVWSGPDGVNALNAPEAGGTWRSPCTPMSDFPVMNANQHALALLGLLRVCGVEPHPSGDGLIIGPQGYPPSFSLDLPLLHVEYEAGRIAGEYRAFVTGERVLHIQIPQKATVLSVTVNGHNVQPQPAASAEVPLKIDFQAGQTVAFEVKWKAE